MRKYNITDCQQLGHDGKYFVVCTDTAIYKLTDPITRLWRLRKGNYVIYTSGIEPMVAWCEMMKVPEGIICIGQVGCLSINVVVNEKGAKRVKYRSSNCPSLDISGSVYCPSLDISEKYLTFSSYWATGNRLLANGIALFGCVDTSKWNHNCLVVFDREIKSVKMLLDFGSKIRKTKISADNTTVAVLVGDDDLYVVDLL